MCLILFGVDASPDFPLVLAANRDEFYARPTRAMAFWADSPHILAGKDLEAGGTWMAVSRRGRFAALTNYRDPADVRPGAPSRGELVLRVLNHPGSIPDALADIQARALDYNGFNLIAGEAGQVFWYSNRRNKIHRNKIRRVEPGWHGLSNHLLDTPWPKVAGGKAKFRAAVEKAPMDDTLLFELLADRTQPPDTSLPDTGVGLEWERTLSPLFIRSPGYGTRSSTLMRMTRAGEILVTERTYDPAPAGQYRDRRFSIDTTL